MTLVVFGPGESAGSDVFSAVGALMTGVETGAEESPLDDEDDLVDGESDGNLARRSGFRPSTMTLLRLDDFVADLVEGVDVMALVDGVDILQMW